MRREQTSLPGVHPRNIIRERAQSIRMERRETGIRRTMNSIRWSESNASNVPHERQTLPSASGDLKGQT